MATRTSSAPATPVLTITTDFGLDDPYVAQMKGVILGLNPSARIVDVSHGVAPQRLLQAVFITRTAWPAFSAGAIHVVVVDPGVGSERRAIALVSPSGIFIGPDNGVLSGALPDESLPPAEQGLSAISLPSGCRAFTIANEHVLHHPVSRTFHGRDVFAQAAGHVSLGLAPEELGEPVGSLVAFPPLRAVRRPDGALEAQVLHIDRFGNVITDARAEDLPAPGLLVEIAGRPVPGPVRTYADATGLAALVGSSGYLEIAAPNDSAAGLLNVSIGDAAIVRPVR